MATSRRHPLQKSKISGTQVKFLPSKKVFSDTKFSFATIQKKMRELAFLTKGISITINDFTHKKSKQVKFKYDGGIVEFVDANDNACVESCDKHPHMQQCSFETAHIHTRPSSLY